MNFANWNEIEKGFFAIENQKHVKDTQALTNNVFSEKWTVFSEEEIAEQEKVFEFQKKWFLELYGFQNEKHLAEHC